MDERQPGRRSQGGTGGPPTGPLLSLAMRQLSRRGLLGWAGKFGLASVMTVGGLAMTASQPEEARAVGCDEVWGDCNPCVSNACCSCNSSCDCACAAGCYNCVPKYVRAHLYFWLGYIARCSCDAC